MQPPSVPGVVLERPLPGRSAWRGRAGREAVDVVVVALVAEPELRRAALAALTPLVGPGDGCLPRCRAAVICRDGVAVVSDAVDGTPLSALPSLQIGHAVAVGRALSQALTALHGRGLRWGGDFAEVLVDDRGTARLPYDTAVRRRVAGGPASAAGDVGAVTALLAAHCPHPGLAELARHPPPRAGALDRHLRRCARARPLLLAGRPPPGLPPPRHRGTRGAVPRRVALSAALGAALLAAGLAGWASVGHGPRGAGVTPLAAPRWGQVLHGLDVARAGALVGALPLAAADAPGAPAYAADAATRAQLVARHLSVAPPVPTLTSVNAVSVSAGQAVLAVTDSLPAYAYRDAAGHLVGSEPARPPHTWTVTLARGSAGWRVASVR